MPERKVEPKKDSSLHLVWLEFKLIVTSMLDKSLLSNWPYLVLWASSFISFLWVGMPYVYLVDKAIDMSVSVDAAAFLLSIIGISRTIGQIALGFLGDLPKISAVQLYGVSIAITGLATLLVPLCLSYSTLSLYSVVFGFFISVEYCLTVLVLVDIVGLDRTTNAFGLLQLAMGIATLLGTPVAGIPNQSTEPKHVGKNESMTVLWHLNENANVSFAGWLYDETGHYDSAFYAAGGWIVFAGLILLPLPLKLCKD